MRIKKSHESGSLMVEVIAVLALLGVMGTMMFRQIQRRNEELDNINMASEIRMVKEATAAYIQANRANLEADPSFCPTIGDASVIEEPLPLADIEDFLPDNWISSDDGSGHRQADGIIHEYQVYLSCYRVNSAAADHRLAMYGTVVPNDPSGAGLSPIPANFSLRRAARVAALIGADGGVHASNDGHFTGTMGAWEIECNYEGGPCAGRHDNFYVATTGMDIYIPETDKTADNTVAVPHNIAFERLHSTDYFSVGSGGTDCVGNYDTTNNQFAHETLATSPTGVGYAPDDTILNPGSTPCDPLFWVGADANTGNGHVFVKNNLNVGNEIHVHDAGGHNTITLNKAGEIIGRVDNTGKGYKLDAANGEITLFETVTASIDGTNRTVQVPTLRLKDGRMETNVTAQYYDNDGNLQTDVYAVDPADESLMYDIRLTSRGGALLSDILPNYILKSTQTITRTAAGTENVTKPSCPHGYAPAITVTPIRYSQYVKSASLNLNLTTNSVSGNSSHSHSISGNINSVTQNINGNANGNTLRVNGTSGNVNGTSLVLTQLPPVNIAIDSDDNQWTVGLTYGGQAPTAADPITALAQTYCVFQDDNRNISHTATSSAVAGNDAGIRIESKQAGVLSPKRTRTLKSCTKDPDCANTESCQNNKCTLLGSCSGADGTAITGKNHTYCLKGQQVYLECFEDTDCTTGDNKTCTNNRCTNTGS